MQHLTPGTMLTRKDIAALYGGNARGFLPRRTSGEVVAGCFDPAKNPRAPFEALVHSSGNAELNAKRLLEQSHPRSISAAAASNDIRQSAVSSPHSSGVPIFLRRAANVWEYVGRFRAVRYSTDPDEVAARIYEIHPRIYERHVREYGEMRGILLLEEA